MARGEEHDLQRTVAQAEVKMRACRAGDRVPSWEEIERCAERGVYPEAYEYHAGIRHLQMEAEEHPYAEAWDGLDE